MKRIALALAAWLLAAAAPFDPFGAATIDDRPGAPIPLHDPLLDADGRPTSLAAIGGGRPILLVPVLHDCPNFCGTTLDAMLSAAERAGIGPAAIVAFGIDPHEGPPAARADLARLAPRHPASIGRVTATTGDAHTVARITAALGYRYAFDPRIGQYAHAAGAAVLTPDGRLVRWLYGIAPASAAMTDAVADARAGRTGGLVDRLILLCYHYDPAEGRYGLAIDRLLKLGCTATALALGLYIWRARRRERRAKPC